MLGRIDARSKVDLLLAQFVVNLDGRWRQNRAVLLFELSRLGSMRMKRSESLDLGTFVLGEHEGSVVARVKCKARHTIARRKILV